MTREFFFWLISKRKHRWTGDSHDDALGECHQHAMRDGVDIDVHTFRKLLKREGAHPKRRGGRWEIIVPDGTTLAGAAE